MGELISSMSFEKAAHPGGHFRTTGQLIQEEIVALMFPGPLHQGRGPLGRSHGVQMGVSGQDVIKDQAFPPPPHAGAPGNPKGHGRVGPRGPGAIWE